MEMASSYATPLASHLEICSPMVIFFTVLSTSCSLALCFAFCGFDITGLNFHSRPPRRDCVDLKAPNILWFVYVQCWPLTIWFSCWIRSFFHAFFFFKITQVTIIVGVKNFIHYR